MLGSFEAQAGDRAVSRFRTRRTALLLAYLALNRRRAHTRDELADLLWPDTDEESSRRSLRQTLYTLRKALEPSASDSEIIEVHQSQISLKAEAMTTDVAEMEDLVNAARQSEGTDRLGILREALNLYRGDLLPGYDELWILNERIRFEDLYVSAVKMAASSCISLSLLDESVEYLRIAASREPHDMSLHKALIRQYLASDRPRRALEHYSDIVHTHSLNTQAKPDPELLHLAAEARSRMGRRRPPDSSSLGAPPAEALSPSNTLESSESIPSTATRFFGREEELAELASLIEMGDAKLLSLVGPAGTGKTRIAIEFTKLLSSKGWQTWFIPLADIGSGSQILDQAYSTVLGPAIQAERRERLASLLDHDRTLVVFDNFEHIIDSGALALQGLMKTLPNAAFLITTRQALNLEAERLLQIGPLPIPSSWSNSSPSPKGHMHDIAGFASVQMFLDRCQAVRRDLQITRDNACHFAGICTKLEGIPLALEIAAGMAKSFSPGQMVTQLERRLLDITSRRRDVPERHRSLRAAVEYTFQTLPEELRTVFAYLSVFRGGFSAESAGGVLAIVHPALTAPGRCLDCLLDLQERSLILAAVDDAEPESLRFRMLETFREFGDELLTPASRNALKDAHAAWYASSHLGEEEENLPEKRAMLHAMIKREYSNYIAAVEHAYSTQQFSLLVGLLISLATSWDVRGTNEIEQNYIRRTASLPQALSMPPADRIRLYRITATTYLRTSDFSSAYSWCENALKVAEEIGDKGKIAECCFGMSLCAGYLGQIDKCIALSEQVLQNAPEANGVLLERTYVSIGSAYWSRDDLEKAEAAFLQAWQVSSRFRNGEPDALILAHLAGLHLDQGRPDEAMIRAAEGLRISERHDDGISSSACLAQVARYHWKKGNVGEALTAISRSLTAVRHLGITMLCLEILRIAALILSSAERHAGSTELFAATAGIECMQKASEGRDVENALNVNRASLSAEQYEGAWTRGLAMSMDEAFMLAAAECGLGAKA